MKKFLPDWQEVRDQSATARKKVLDKMGIKKYNIHKGMEEALMKDHSVDLTRSINIQADIKLLGEQAKTVAKDIAPLAPPPIIAGGMVRDMVFGLPWNDCDIFVDLGAYSTDEADDICLLMVNEIAPEYIEDLTQKLDNPEEGYGFDPSANGTGFVCGYGGYNKVEGGYSAHQVLGRMDNKENTIDKFDYGLVKAYYDTETEEFVFHKDFVDQIGKKIIEVSSAKTFNRVTKWLNRNKVMWDKYTPRIVGKEAIKPKNIYFNTASSGTVDWQRFIQNVRVDVPPLRLDDIIIER